MLPRQAAQQGPGRQLQGVCEQGPWRSRSRPAFEMNGEVRQEALGQVGML